MSYRDPYTGEWLHNGRWETDAERELREQAEDEEASAHMNDEEH